MGAFEYVPILLKNGIDSIQKFQETDSAVLQKLGIQKAQLYQAKIKKALLALLPALAFTDSVSSANKKQLQTSTSNTQPNVSTETAVARDVRAGDIDKLPRASNFATSPSTTESIAVSAAKQNQSPGTSSTRMDARVRGAVAQSATGDTLKAQIELKVFFSTANLPLKFGNLMFLSYICCMK